MYVKINRNVCNHHLATCERCLGRFLEYPMGYERRCFESLEDDGKDELTLEIHSENNVFKLVLDAEQRHLMAGEGWATFMDEAVPMYRDS